jgi:hypothetical protein
MAKVAGKTFCLKSHLLRNESPFPSREWREDFFSFGRWI